MASNNNRGRSNRGGRNNNPTGRNQYSGGMMDVVRDRPVAAATAAVGAAAAGLFLWSKRSQISDQLSSLSDQISEWREGMQSGEGFMARGESADQSDIAEEALTLKQTGKRTKRPTDPTVEAQTKAGSVAY